MLSKCLHKKSFQASRWEHGLWQSEPMYHSRFLIGPQWMLTAACLLSNREHHKTANAHQWGGRGHRHPQPEAVVWANQWRAGIEVANEKQIRRPSCKLPLLAPWIDVHEVVPVGDFPAFRHWEFSVGRLCAFEEFDAQNISELPKWQHEIKEITTRKQGKSWWKTHLRSNEVLSWVAHPFALEACSSHVWMVPGDMQKTIRNVHCLVLCQCSVASAPLSTEPYCHKS